ncbi:heterokaryon incompatibility protein-domain-containing protein [Astrocystis sublimbata]|nr:heterokaryon incompatibility protein-domain-containing protein [Astrocystis sublimbata]
MSDIKAEEVWRQHLYLQTRLKEKNGRIRLLTIQPRQYTASRSEAPPDAIHCFLRLAELKEHPRFTVVAHRWHSADAVDESRSVLVNGTAVPVSAGLYEVLQHLQTQTDAVVVWIDALCINHADENEREKSVQVAQLTHIFAAAEKSFIWLGGTADRSDEAMKALRRLADEQLTLSAYVTNWTPQAGLQLAQKVLPSRFVNTNSASTTPGSAEPLELQQELDSLRAPLKALMERTYWTELWSFVELCLTHKGVVVCGRHGLALDHFSSAARALDHIINHLMYSKWLAAATNPKTGASNSVLSSEEVSNLSHSPALRVISRRDDYRKDAVSWLKSPDVPLLTLLSQFYAAPVEDRPNLRVDNPRDRVYALLCLATDIPQLGIVVDYSKDPGQVDAETSAALLQKNPRILQLARGTTTAGDDSTSWAVDWANVRLPPAYLGLAERPFNACGPADIRYYRVETDAPGRISVKAGIVDQVQEAGTPYQPDEAESTEQQRTYLSEIKQFWEDSTASISSPYFAEQEAVALAKISVGDIESNPGPNAFTRASTSTIEGYRKTAEALFPTETGDDDNDDGAAAEPQENEELPAPAEAKSNGPNLSIPYTAAMAWMAGRRPFRSNNGYIGLGPAGLAVGDTIAIPYGSSVPFAFRRTEEGEDGAYHRLVGEVYVFGIMDGEYMKVHRRETMLRIV